MNTLINDGGPAFPTSLGIESGYGNTIPHQLPNGVSAWETMMPGMSLRDWFAGQALVSSFVEAIKFMPSRMTAEEYAESLYSIADAMLKVRNQNTADQ